MRIIDADVARDKLLYGEAYISDELDSYIERIFEELPTVDAVPVIRCKDCKWYETSDFGGDILCGCCLNSAMTDINPDGFCSYGERKDGEHE